MDFGLRFKVLHHYLLNQGVGHSYSYVVHHRSLEHPLFLCYFQLFAVKENTFLELAYVQYNFVAIDKMQGKKYYDVVHVSTLFYI